MSSGQLKHLITFRARDIGADGAGQPLATWSDVSTVWAEILHSNGAQALRGGAEVSLVRASVKIRKCSGISADMRFVDVSSGAVYDIKAVLPDMVERRYLYLVAELAS